MHRSVGHSFGKFLKIQLFQHQLNELERLVELVDVVPELVPLGRLPQNGDDELQQRVRNRPGIGRILHVEGATLNALDDRCWSTAETTYKLP